jgi:hypothetical protein
MRGGEMKEKKGKGRTPRVRTIRGVDRDKVQESERVTKRKKSTTVRA